MKKIILLGLLIFSIGNAREMDGIFIGFETGGGENQLKMSDISFNQKHSYTSAIYGGKIGYKYFFNDWLGIRGYANVDYSGSQIVQDYSNTIGNGRSDVKYGFITYAVNADVLLNFYNTESYSIGAFLGIGLGGQSTTYEQIVITTIVTTGSRATASRYIKENISGFYSDFKVGLRATAGNHGMDFIAKIPFVETKKTIQGIDAKVKQNYQILLGYNFSF